MFWESWTYMVGAQIKWIGDFFNRCVGCMAIQRRFYDLYQLKHYANGQNDYEKWLMAH